MAQETITTEARTPTTLKVETSVSLPAFEAIAKKMTKNSAEVARQAFGEDSCTPFTLQGTLEVDGVLQVIDESGMIEIGTSYERAQTSAFKTTNAMRDAIALMGMFAPKMGEAIMASMMASRDGGDSAQALLDNGFNISQEALDRANAFMADLATSSVRTVSAGVKVSLDA
tara:strand:+ start:3273 stop:3785 length:513 start_codon:yes stop_codon:yes gene_type:complete